MPNNLSQNTPFLAQGGKIDPLSEIRNAGIITSGKVLWVSDEADSAHRTRTDEIGASNIRLTYQDAINATATDQNDYVMVIPRDANAVRTIGTAIDINKDRVHLLSVGYNRSPVGYGNTIRGFATVATGTPVDASMIDITGAGVEMAGFKVLGTAGTSDGGTVAQLVRVGSDSPWLHDMSIEADDSAPDTTLLDGPGTTVGGRFDNVKFAQTGTADANTSLITIPAAAKRWEFNDCSLYHHCSNVADAFVACGTGPTFTTEFNRCNFVNSNIGTISRSAVQGSVTVDDGAVLLSYCTGQNVTDFGTDPSVHVAPVASGTIPKLYNPGIAKGTAAIVAA